MKRKITDTIVIIVLSTIGEFLIISVGVSAALYINSLSNWILLNLLFTTLIAVTLKFFAEYIKDKTEGK